MTLDDYAGYYYLMEMLLEVRQEDGSLYASMPGVPPGFEIRLQPVGEDAFRLHGGPVSGSTAAFKRNENGEITTIEVGNFELAKISFEKARSLPAVERLVLPAFALTGEKQAAFEALLEKSLAGAGGQWINYDLPYPKHEFVQFIMAQDLYIFHGSGKQDIDTFKPVRTSVELFDKRGIGNLQAVYGTHDGIWAMFFAVVDRPKLNGTIRNGVNYFHDAFGRTLAAYNFSINKDQLDEKPWREGALYLLPRASFERQWLTDDSPANEWASFEPVQPIARLHLDPEDFPFLDQIGGHDDGVMIRLEGLAREVRSQAVAASMNDDQFTISLPSSDQNRSALEEMVGIQAIMVPAAVFEISEKDESTLQLTVRSLPPAFRQVYGQMYADLMDTK